MKYLKSINEAYLIIVKSAFDSVVDKNTTETVHPGSLEWEKFAKQYHLYDDYYFYRDTILKVITKESGGWFVDELSKVDIDPIEFKENIFDRIKKLKEAFNKIPT
jgi:hypothetical protein